MSGYPNQPPQGPSPPHAHSAPSEDDYYTDDRHSGVLAVSQTQSRPRASASGRRDLPPPSASRPALPHASLEVIQRQSTSGPPYGRTNYQHSSQSAYQRTHSQSANGPSHPHDHDRLRLQHDYAHNVNTPSAPPTRPPAASRRVITEPSGSVQALNNYYQDKKIRTSYIAYSNPIPLGGDQFTVSVTLRDQACQPRFDGHAVGKHAAKEVAAQNALLWLRSQNHQPTDHYDEGLQALCR